VAGTDREKIVAIMKDNCRHAYLATCEGDEPRLRPVSPIVEDDMTIWVTTFATSRKVKQIKANANVCLAFVEQPAGDNAATAFGRAEIVEDAGAKKRVWGLAYFDLAEYFAAGPADDEFCLLKIAPRRVEWRDSWEGCTNIYEP